MHGYRAAMEADGAPVPPGYVTTGLFDYANGVKKGGAMLDLPEPPTAIFAGCDEIALGVFEAARARGLRDRLIDVTLEIIADQALAVTTYRTIADLAGVPLGSMTYHFPTREDLIFAAFERFANESFSSLDDAVADVVS